MEKIKVVEFTEAWTPGGVESYIINIADNLNKDRFDVVIWATQVFADLFDEDLKRIGISLYKPVEIKPFLNPIKRTINGLKIFNKTIRELPCDVIHLHAANGVAWIYAYMAKKCGKKVIFHAHASSLGNQNRILKMIPHVVCKTMLSGYADLKLACSDKAAEFLYPHRFIVNNEVEYINCIVDIERFRFRDDTRKKMRLMYDIDSNETVFLNVGRLQHQKNHYFLLDLFNEITHILPGKLFIIGEGGELERIKERIKEFGLEKKVVLVKKTREVEKYMFMSDVFLLPSYHEGNPIVTVEAQASGLPCYISDRVTKAAKLLDVSKFIGINDAKASAKVIVEDIEKKTCFIDRNKAIGIVMKKGYDKEKQIEQLETIYTSV